MPTSPLRSSGRNDRSYRGKSTNKMATRVAKAKKAACARGSKTIVVKHPGSPKKVFTLASKKGTKCRWHDKSKKHGAPKKHNCLPGQKYSYYLKRCTTPGTRGAPRKCPVGQKNLCIKRACGTPRARPGRPSLK